MAATFSRAPRSTARMAVNEARTAPWATRERVVFLLVMPLILAVVNGWALTSEGAWFTRPQSVLYWTSGVLPLWWLDTAVARAGARWRPLSAGVGFWLWVALVPLLTFNAAGLVGFFTWRWELFASWFLGHVPQRSFPPTGSAGWWLWMLKGSVVPIITWTVANVLQRQLFGRTLIEPERAPAATPPDSLSSPPDPPSASTGPVWVPAEVPLTVTAEAAPAPAPPDFLRRLDKPLTGALLAVQAQEHYIRLVAEGSAPMLLYRFSDALEQLRPQQGLQVHRSWWVALAAIAAVERDNGRVSLQLVNGERVPVSRRHVGAVELALRGRGDPRGAVIDTSRTAKRGSRCSKSAIAPS